MQDYKCTKQISVSYASMYGPNNDTESCFLRPIKLVINSILYMLESQMGVSVTTQ